MTKRLSLSTLEGLNEELVRPQYALDEYKVGIVHLGIGAFHRGHQAVFTDDALAKSGGNWRIVGVSLRSAGVANQLNPQDGLYTLTSKHKDSVECRVIGAIDKVLVAPEDPQKVIDIMAQTRVKVLTLTVTEKGYHFDLSKNALNTESTDIQHDLAHPLAPITMPGYIVAACLQRMKKVSEWKDAKLSVISCDNLPNNGEITQSVVLAMAAHYSQELHDWISDNVGFCSSMVDRIVPAVSDEHRSDFAASMGIEDQGVIQTEPFKQWVIQDNFASDIPDWASAGALIVPQVETYERLKLRTLNGSHSALAYIGVLLGFTWIHEAINDPLLEKVIHKMMVSESGPSLIVPTGFDLPSYQQSIIERFQNDQIPYATQQVAMDGSQKIVQRVLAPIQELLARSNNDMTKVGILTTVVTAWLVYLKAKTEDGETYAISDPIADKLKLISNKSTSAEELVDAMFTQTSIFPDALTQNSAFKQYLIGTLKSVRSAGLRVHLATLL
jgi:fructuronate reductase